MYAVRTLRILSSAAAAALGLSLLAGPGYSQVLTASASESAGAGSAPLKRAAVQNELSIRPFRFVASDEELADLRRRISATRWPEKETVPDATQGVQLATMRKLAHYWANEYDWRKVEARLNALPQFVTTIDGLDIHFIHVRSKHPNALPMIVTHG